MQYSNPFSIRASERIFSIDTFLDMLSAEPLTSMESLHKDGKLWNNVTYIQSSPGGGKTTLLRMFSTEAIQRISLPKHKLYNTKLKSLDVKSDEVIKRLAVYVLLSRDYGYIEDEFENKYCQSGVFYALLNTRIMAAIVKTILSYTQVLYKNRREISFHPSKYQERFVGLDLPCSLDVLMEWIADRERKICDGIGGFVGDTSSVIMDSNLFVFEAITPSCFVRNEECLGGDFIFQLDDVHKLTRSQQELLSSSLVETRRNSTIWLAERLESISATEMLNKNNKEGRDFNKIQLDGNEDNSRRYRVMIETIAENRAKFSMTELSLINSLRDCPYANQFSKLYNKASERYVKEISKLDVPEIYSEWKDWLLKLPGGEEKAVLCRAFLIYLNRQIKTGEVLALFNFPQEICAPTLLPIVNQGASSLVTLENKIPMYYGFSTLIDISTHNVEQFLSFAEKMFSFLLAQRVQNDADVVLDVYEQDRIIKDISKEKYSQILSLPNGVVIQRFVECLVKFCKKETFSPAFSYRFVSGFAISQEHDLRKGIQWYEEAQNMKLAELLRDCVAFNILEQDITTQGAAGQKWTVFYLSRWICVACGLALNKGGWRKLGINTLNNWLKGI